MANTQKMLGSFSLTMIAVAAIIDLRGLPMMASYGLSAIFFYTLAALLFFIPNALVCAELSTQVKETGGMYTWVNQACGKTWGFFSIWLEWLNNIIGFPASLSFIAVSLSYLIQPQLAHHKIYILLMTLGILWSMTGFTLLGIKASSRLNIAGTILGTIIPALILTGLGMGWIFLGKPLSINFSWNNIVPDLKNLNPGFFATMILGFGGMQIIAFHRQNMSNPKQSCPRAVFGAFIIVMIIAMLGSLAIAIIVPNQELNIVSGLSDGFCRFFANFHLNWAAPILIILMILGMLATFNAWFLGPARGMVIAARAGFFPPIFSQVNKHDVPTRILLLQAVICTLLSTIFLYMPNVSAGFWVLLNLSSQSALLVYILIFISSVILRYQRKENIGYKIPGGFVGLVIIAGIGILSCVVALVSSVIPPRFISMGNLWHYEEILLTSNLIFLSIPLLLSYIYSRRISLDMV